MDNQQQVATAEALTNKDSEALAEALGDKSSPIFKELLLEVDNRLLRLTFELAKEIKDQIKTLADTFENKWADHFSDVSKMLAEMKSDLTLMKDEGASVNKKVDELTARIGKWCVLPCASPSFLLLTRDDLGTSPCIQNEPARVKAAENVVKLEA